MKKLLATLPLVVALAAAPAFAGTLGTVATEPEIDVPPPPPGSLSFSPLYLIPPVVILCALACDSDDETTTTTTYAVTPTSN